MQYYECVIVTAEKDLAFPSSGQAFNNNIQQTISLQCSASLSFRSVKGWLLCDIVLDMDAAIVGSNCSLPLFLQNLTNS